MPDLILQNDLPDDPKNPYRIKSVTIRERKPREETLEGRELITLDQAQEKANEWLTAADQSMFFGGIRTNTKTNVAYTGLTQVGKTSAMKLHIAEVLERIKAGSKEKVIIFDATNEFVPFVYAHLGDTAPIYILNPSDARCHQWDLSADLKGAANVNDLSHTLVKDKQGDTPFFTEGARGFMAGILNSFYLSVAKDKKNLEWTLKDVANATRTGKRIRNVLSAQPEYLSYLVEAFLDRTNQDVYSSLIARTQELWVIAAMWDKRPLFSLRRDFLDLDKGAVLMLGADSDNRATILELNRLIIERAGRIIANREETEEARYWFFLDEFQLLGKTEILKPLIKDGLKRGIRVHIACQNRADAIGTYGKEDASVIFSESAAHYIFKQGDENSAEEARKAIGKRKLRRWTRGETLSMGRQEGRSETHTHGVSTTSGVSGNQTNNSTTESWSDATNTSESKSAGYTQSLTEQVLEEPVITTGALQNLEIGEFVCINPTVTGYWKHKYSWQAIAPIVKAKSEDPRHARFVKRDEEFFDYLADWTPKDLERLGLPADTIKQESKKKEKTKREERGDEEEGQSIVQRINKRFS